MWERSDEHPRPLHLQQSPFQDSVGITAAILVVTAIAGFIVLPFAQPWVQFANVWDAICSAAGVPQRAASVTAPEQDQTPFRGRADLAHALTSEPGSDRPRRHAGAALRDLPRPDRRQPRGLAQPRRPICRRDLQGAARFPLRRAHQCRDVAVRRQPDGPGNRRSLELLRLSAAASGLSPDAAIAEARIVIYGAPMRGIAPCGACHGSLDNKTGSPWLEGQSEAYMKAQLQALRPASGATTSASRCATSPAP